MHKFLLATLALSLASPAYADLPLANSGKAKNFLYENDSKALASTVQLVFKTGSMADPKGKEGLASVAFQSLLRGTKSKERKDFFAAVERYGASLGVDTGTNRTIITLDSISDNLKASISLLAEAVLQPGLKDAEIASLIKEELAQRQQEMANNRSIMKRVFRQAIFPNSSLSFPPEGTIDGLKAITADDVRGFLATQVKAGNAAVAVMSNHSEKDVKSWIEQAFVNLPEGSAPALPSPRIAAGKGTTLYIVERKGSSVSEVAVGHLGITANRPDREILETGLFILGADMSSRLFQTLRGKNGWTYGAYAGFQLLEIPRSYGGSFMMYTFPHAEHTEKATLKAIELYRDYAASGVTAKELAFAKESLTNQYPFKFAASRSRLTAKLYEYLDGAPNLSVAKFRSLVNGISRTALLSSIKKAHDPANLVIVAVGDPEKIEPLKKSLPGIRRVVVVTDPMQTFPANEMRVAE